jgi:hypothetical protein
MSSAELITFAATRYATRFALPVESDARREKGQSFSLAIVHVTVVALMVSLFFAQTTQAQSAAAWYGANGYYQHGGGGAATYPPGCNPPFLYSNSNDVGALESVVLAEYAQCANVMNGILPLLANTYCGTASQQLVPVNPPGPFQESIGTNWSSYDAFGNTGTISCTGLGILYSAVLSDDITIWTCPSGQVPNFLDGPLSCTTSLAPYYFLVLPDSVPAPAGPADSSATAQGNVQTPEPINPATGNESLSETDYRSGDGRLQITRTYNSRDLNINHIGISWRTNFLDRALVATALLGSMPANTVSSIFADPGSACTQGWAGLAPYQTGQTGVTASWNGSTCNLSNGKTLTVQSADQPSC